MSDAYIIEIADETAGIVVRQQSDKGYRFHAALPKYFPLDGHVFAAPRDAERAASAHFNRKRRVNDGARV
jgi:hypothetical protein